MAHYDYLVVGAGLTGAVFAHEARRAGKTCLVIDRRDHIAGNVYTRKVNGINVHEYGAHIFHTSDKRVWDYVNQFAEFNNYVNAPVANYHGELYNLPFNMNTFSKMWGVSTPAEARAKIDEQVAAEHIGEPANLEEQALSLVGRDIFEKLVKEYTEKQWGRDCKDLPAFIIKRLPVRLVFDNNYFNDRYQGIPIGGYTKMVERMLEGTDVRLNCDYKELVAVEPDIADRVTREYPADWKPGDEPYYPLNDEKNNALYEQYAELARKEDRVVFAGRLGAYKYYDMAPCIAAALDLCEAELG